MLRPLAAAAWGTKDFYVEDPDGCVISSASKPRDSRGLHPTLLAALPAGPHPGRRGLADGDLGSVVQEEVMHSFGRYSAPPGCGGPARVRKSPGRRASKYHNRPAAS